MDDETVLRLIRVAVGDPNRLSRAQARVKGPRTGYRSAWAVSVRERVVAELWLGGMPNHEIQTLMRYRSDGTVSRIIKRMGLKDEQTGFYRFSGRS